MTLDLEKSRARLQAKQRRAQAHNSESRIAAGVDLIAHFPAPQFRGHKIAGYWPLPGEIDIRPLLQALETMGETLALPCTPRKGHPLVFRHWQTTDRLKAGPYNTREPFPQKPEIRPSIVLMPLLAFTDGGERLGYGGGFYDRTLASLQSSGPVFACGVAYDGQKAHTLPTGRYDMRLDAILTETGFRKFT